MGDTRPGRRRGVLVVVGVALCCGVLALKTGPPIGGSGVVLSLAAMVGDRGSGAPGLEWFRLGARTEEEVAVSTRGYPPGLLHAEDLVRGVVDPRFADTVRVIATRPVSSSLKNMEGPRSLAVVAVAEPLCIRVDGSLRYGQGYSDTRQCLCTARFCIVDSRRSRTRCVFGPHAAKPRPQVTLRGLHVAAVVSFGDSFAHLVQDAVPLASLMRGVLGPAARKASRLLWMEDSATLRGSADSKDARLSPWAPWFARRALGIDPSRVTKFDPAVDHCVEAAVLFAYDPAYTFAGAPRAAVAAVSSAIGAVPGASKGSAVPPAPPLPGDTVVYLSRAFAGGNGRHARNDAEVVEALRALVARSMRPGTRFVVFRGPAGRDNDAIASIFARARVVVGLHGGAFANVIFSAARGRGVAVEVLVGGDAARDWRSLVRGVGFEYETVRARSNPEIGGAAAAADPDAESVVVPVESVVQAVLRHCPVALRDLCL